MRYNETTEDVVITGTKYQAPSMIAFHIPEGADITCEIREVLVNRQDGQPLDSRDHRTLMRTMTADLKNTEFAMYDRQGNFLRNITYKDLFFAVESFYLHVAELTDEEPTPPTP